MFFLFLDTNMHKDGRPVPRSASVINDTPTEGLLIACLLPSSQSFHLPASVNTRLTDEQLRTGLN